MTIEIAPPLPSNLDAERSLLGACLLNHAAALEVFTLVTGSDFFSDAHRLILWGLHQLNARGIPADLVTLAECLRSSGNLERAGGHSYLASLVDGVPRVSHVSHYADIVRSKAKLRQIIHFTSDIRQRAFDADLGEVDELIESAVISALNIADDAGGPVLARSWRDVADSTLREVDRALLHPEKATRINFGLSDLDDMTAGLRRRELVSIVAPTSNGKTLFAAQGAFQADRDGFKTLFFSAEMPGEDIALREIAYQGGVKFYYARRPEKLSEDERRRLNIAAAENLSLRFVDRDITPTRIWAMCEAAKKTKGLDLVVVDYDQLVIEAGMNPDSEDDRIFRHQRAFIFGAKKLAERLDLCFVLLSQLRKLPSNVLKGAAPHLDDIWGDSSVRNTPHVILWLSRDFFTHNMDKAHERKARVYVLKSRNGRTGIVTLEFDPELVRFTDAQPTEEDSVPERSAMKRQIAAGQKPSVISSGRLGASPRISIRACTVAKPTDF
jgi:replicative DNA helicase